ncbi:ABC transporter substrate-binding protein [Pseudocolwellia sp. HL-MZ7]|uniref:ABC transporter substrate-binding protein n=1 Tax=Pseudocolwellia sp. HL-MZ7 TaxID=3400627 RepID=UPI003CFA4A1D
MAFIKISKTLIHFILIPLLSYSSYSFSEGKEQSKVTVIYPDVKSSSNNVFPEIVKGIKSAFKGEVITLKLPQNFNSKDIISSITTQQVIALGKPGLVIGKEVNHNKLVVLGALPVIAHNMSGISSMASPQSLFEPLKTLAPKVQNITVVYSKSSAWLMEDAKKEAKRINLHLNAILVDDLQMVVKTYDDFFQTTASENTVLWLPLDPISVNDTIIVPTLLEKAWNNKVTIISSTPSHVKRGVLYATVPDHISMGQQLAIFMQKIENKNISSIVKALKTIKLAINLRTAKHLGYQYSQSKIEEFAFTFPE